MITIITTCSSCGNRHEEYRYDQCPDSSGQSTWDCSDCGGIHTGPSTKFGLCLILLNRKINLL